MILRACFSVVLALGSAAVAAQSGAPTRTPVPSTAAEEATVVAGIRLHDQGKFDEAIAKYEEVLRLNPANMAALYEMAYSFAASHEFEKSLAAATRGTEYESELLPLFYDLIGSAHDSLGEAQKAIEAYKKGIQFVPHAAMLYYNMGVTYLESLKNQDEARQAFKKAVSLDPKQPAFHLMLGQAFQTDGRTVPALLAFSTYLIQEPAGPHALSAYGFWRAILRGATPAAAAASGDEGDFHEVEAAIARSQQTVIEEMDRGSAELPAFLAHMNRIVARLADQPADRGTLTGAYYLPFFAELKAKNFVETFVYWSMQRAPVDGVRDWLNGHADQVKEFVAWSQSYNWPKP